MGSMHGQLLVRDTALEDIFARAIAIAVHAEDQAN